MVFLAGGGAVGLDYLNVAGKAAGLSTSVLYDRAGTAGVAGPACRGLFAQEMTGWPAAIREVLIERHVSPAWLRTGLQEAGNIDQLYDEVRHAGPMPDVPLIILSSMGTDGFKQAVLVGESESLLREEIEGKRRLYTDFARSVPRGEVRLVDAGHVTLHLRHPEAVLGALADLPGQVHAGPQSRRTA